MVHFLRKPRHKCHGHAEQSFSIFLSLPTTHSPCPNVARRFVMRPANPLEVYTYTEKKLWLKYTTFLRKYWNSNVVYGECIVLTWKPMQPLYRRLWMHQHSDYIQPFVRIIVSIDHWNVSTPNLLWPHRLSLLQASNEYRLVVYEYEENVTIEKMVFSVTHPIKNGFQCEPMKLSF